jgi:hypothetical protein
VTPLRGGVNEPATTKEGREKEEGGKEKVKFNRA